jgi:hypothetical protein
MLTPRPLMLSPKRADNSIEARGSGLFRGGFANTVIYTPPDKKRMMQRINKGFFSIPNYRRF